MEIKTSPFKYRKEDGTFSDIIAINGKNAIINGVNTLELIAGNNIELTQIGEEMTISATGGDVKSYIYLISQDNLIDGKTTINHNLNNENLAISVYDSDSNLIIPDNISIASLDSIEISLASFVPLEGNYKIVILCDSNEIDTPNIGYNIRISQSDLTDGAIDVEHNLKNENVIVTVYDENKSIIIPTGITIIDENNIKVNLADFEPLVGIYNIFVLSDSTGSIDMSGAILYNETQYLSIEEQAKAKENMGLIKDFQNVYDAIPTNTSDLTNDSGFITNIVNNLTNYYTISQVDAIVAALNQTLSYEVVDTLPTTDIKTNVIYLTLVEGSTNNYKMNMYISDVWYILGETAINLSDYVLLTTYNTKMTEIDTSLNNKQNVMIQKNTLDGVLETNTEYTISASGNIPITDANGWGIVNLTAINNLALMIPNTHKWSDGIDGYVENGTQVMFMYDNKRWSRIDWR